jgi:DNA-binding PucR family transcriptional regulator
MATVERDLDSEVRRQLAVVFKSVDPGELGEKMAAELIATIPELQGPMDEDLRAALVASCTGNLRVIWAGLSGGTPHEQFSPPADAIAWAHDLAHRGMPLAALLRTYRIGQAFATDRVVQATGELAMEPEVRWHLLERASRYFFEYVDAICTHLVVDYEQERARWIRGAAAARAELVSAIIDGQTIDARAATDTLRYDVSRNHLAFIVWTDLDAGSAEQRSGSLEVAAMAFAKAVGGGPVLLIPIGERAVWGWTSGGSVGEDAGDTRVALADGMRAAIGTPAPGVAGMAASHDQARAARRVADLLGVRPRTVMRYGTVALTALLTIEPSEAVRFAVSQLGELAADNDNMTRLRATLRVYYEENLSPARAARRLGVHQNTIVYRVKRVEEILGHTVEQGRLELEVALRLSEGLDGLRSAAERRRPA